MEPGLWKRVVRNPNMVVGTEVDSVVVLGDPQKYVYMGLRGRVAVPQVI